MSVPLLLAAAALATQPAAALNPAAPPAWAGLPAQAYSALPQAQAIKPRNGLLHIALPTAELAMEVTGSRRHANGDTSYSARLAGGQGQASLTVGAQGAFGELRRGDEHFIITTDQRGSWLVRLPDDGVSYNQCGTDHRHKAAWRRSEARAEAASAAPGTVIDLLVIYNQALGDRYPGALVVTRINHLVDIANQTMANSQVDLGFRLVGAEFFEYTNGNSNQALLNDLKRTLDGNPAPGLQGLQAMRDARGADLVIMLRPHAIEKRGNCGIAFFPANNDANLGVNVVSDGMSSWSLCLDDVLTHEIGHNLGASHQRGQGGGAFDNRGSAFVRPGRLTTMMGSFGTGFPDRFRGLQVFSSPLIDCGGVPCGDAALTDNAQVLREVMGPVANYRPASSNLPLPDTLARAQADSDGDGEIDWDDFFPFDPAEQADQDDDAVGDAGDAFPADPSEQTDTDGDGVGDNADADDDGDGVDDGVDAFPLDPAESRDDDLDGVGNNADAFAVDASEFSDFDQDGVGNHADADDDGDGVAEFHPVARDLLVISTGNSRILRFDAATGSSRGIEVPPSDSLLTFQSDLAWRPTDHTLVYLGDSSARRMDLLNRKLLGAWLPAFDDRNEGVLALDSGFPTAVESLQDGARMGFARRNNSVLRRYQGQETPREHLAGQWRIAVPANPIDLLADGDGALVLGQNNKSIYRVNELGFTFLSGPDAPWMQDPRYMIFSADGRLFVSDRGRDAVVALDANNGDFLGDFADLRANGFRDPTGLALTGEGELLVASEKQSAILAFDAATGAFLGVRVPRRSWGLRQPGAMILVPAWLDRMHDDPQRLIRPNAGLWYNPASDGRGFDIEVFGRRLSAIWYTYDAQGLPVWYFSAGILDGFEYRAPLFRFSRDAQGEASPAQVGELSLVFGSERQAEMSFTLGAIQGGESLEWLAFDANESGRDHTGLWNRDDGPGWGISMATQGSTTVAIAFIYDDSGDPRWVISTAEQGGSSFDFEMLAAFSTSLCPGCQGPAQVQFEPAGGMQLELEGDSSWSSDVTLPAPLSGDWLLQALPIVRISDSPAPPR